MRRALRLFATFNGRLTDLGLTRSSFSLLPATVTKTTSDRNDFLKSSRERRFLLLLLLPRSLPPPPLISSFPPNYQTMLETLYFLHDSCDSRYTHRMTRAVSYPETFTDVKRILGEGNAERERSLRALHHNYITSYCNVHSSKLFSEPPIFKLPLS